MQTIHFKRGQSYLFRLPPGEDLVVGLYRVCREQNIACGVFMVHGAVRNATIGHLDQGTGQVQRRALDSEYDLVHCSGNISSEGDRFSVRAYAVLSDREGRVMAGELLAAEVFVAEVSCQELRGRVPVRTQDPETGLSLWPPA